MLYNGIELPPVWPPRGNSLPDHSVLPPYLTRPPAVIPIDIGRQLFVDDFLIEQTTLKRTLHTAQYHSASPVLKPDQPWEQAGGPTAMVFSDGVWYDPRDRLFKLWYMGGYARSGSTCYATSRDGIHWEKPALDVRPGTNIVHSSPRDSTTVWLDLEEQDPQRRYKLFLYDFAEQLSICFSADGMHWGKEVARTGPTGDRATIFYNSFRGVWVYGLRGYTPEAGRIRLYREHRDVLAGAKWKEGEPVLWVGADHLDPRRTDLDTRCELYNLDVVAYESLLLGLFTIWRGQPIDRPKPNDICVGFSRDGFHWHRPDRQAFIAVSERLGDWNWGNIQSAGGCCLVVGDNLYFYVSGRAGIPSSAESGVSSTGLAMLRRDGFASMDAGKAEGMLTTRPVQFSGKYLFINLDADEGELRAEVLDRDGKVIPPFTYANCIPLRGDKTLLRAQWNGTEDLSKLARRPVKLRFHLRRGSLYAFWVSMESSGASHSFVAAGGPGFTGPTDIVGVAK